MIYIFSFNCRLLSGSHLWRHNIIIRSILIHVYLDFKTVKNVCSMSTNISKAKRNLESEAQNFKLWCGPREVM
jgi:hypothetical protein